MFYKIKNMYFLLSSEQRIQLGKLQFLIIIMSLFEVVSVASIGPFMALVADIDIVIEDGVLAGLYKFSGLKTPNEFLFASGLTVLLIMLISGVFSIYTTWKISIYSQKVGAEVSFRLFSHYMNQPWSFHSRTSSSRLVNRIAQECNRLTNQVIHPLMLMNAKIILALSLTLAVFIINPLVALVGFLIFSLSYFFIYKSVRGRLETNGANVSSLNGLRLKLMNEGFGGIKNTLLLNRQDFFNSSFETAGLGMAEAVGVNSALAQTPRYIMELVAYLSVICLVLFSLIYSGSNIEEVLPVLSIYALAGLKMLPAFQQIYSSFARIKGNISAFESVENDLRNSQKTKLTIDNLSEKTLDYSKSIELKSVSVTYKDKEIKALEKLNIFISKNEVVGFVGSSGSGKSTAVDVLLGLLVPDEGALKIDGKVLKNIEKSAWQKRLGFVPQDIFLSDASIKENIAFGLGNKDINEDKINLALKLSHLQEFINELPKGVNTLVGERGVQLSGGQRQRIGIARALYNDADVLIFDEATSALDGSTEKVIMEAINDFIGKKTIVIVAHRLSTVMCCDRLFLFEKGRVVDVGSYSELLMKNEKFRDMAGKSK